MMTEIEADLVAAIVMISDVIDMIVLEAEIETTIETDAKITVKTGFESTVGIGIEAAVETDVGSTKAGTVETTVIGAGIDATVKTGAKIAKDKTGVLSTLLI